jgi:hypothetical protein
MKKIFLILLGIISITHASIGSISAIRGEVNIFRDHKHFLAHKGSLIEERDLIETSKGAKVQILFNDKGVISLGQKSKFKIEKYLFTKKYKEAKFHVLKGAFKSITGKIGKIAPKKFQLKTQNATIGVRGTIFIGETSNKEDHIVCNKGSIFITTPNGQIVLSQNQKSTIRKNFAPSPARKIEAVDRKLFEKVEITTSNFTPKPKVQKIKQNAPIITNMEFNNLKKEVEYNKQNWGEWNKKIIIPPAPDIKKDTPIKEVDEEVTPNDEKDQKEDEPIKKREDKPIEKKSEQEEIEEPKSEIIYDENSFQALINRAGNSTPSYHGQVEGYVKTDIDNSKTNILLNDKNSMNLNFDLGDGSLKGDVAFQTQMQQNWSTKISGTVEQNGQFDFSSQKYDGGGDGQLSGDALERANGNFNLINKIKQGGIIHTAVGTFQITKKDGK